MDSQALVFNTLMMVMSLLSFVFCFKWVIILQLQDKLKKPSYYFLGLNLALVSSFLISQNLNYALIYKPEYQSSYLLLKIIADVLVVTGFTFVRGGLQALHNVRSTLLENVGIVLFTFIGYTVLVVMNYVSNYSFALIFCLSSIFVLCRLLEENINNSTLTKAELFIQLSPFFILAVVILIKLLSTLAKGVTQESYPPDVSSMWAYLLVLGLVNASLTSAVVQNVLKQIVGMSLMDSLTGLPGRKAVEQAIEREQARVDRSDVSYCVVMFDLDHFKKINDLFGHAGGDAALQFVSKLFATKLRKIDTFGRWGGEEFVIILPKTKLDDAVKIAEKLKTLLFSSAMQLKNHNVILSASFGVVESNTADNSVNETVARADAAMYRAKKEGRNRVCTNMQTKKYKPTKAHNDLDGLEVSVLEE